MKKICKHQLYCGQMERVPQARHGSVSRVTAEIQQQLPTELRAQLRPGPSIITSILAQDAVSCLSETIAELVWLTDPVEAVRHFFQIWTAVLSTA